MALRTGHGQPQKGRAHDLHLLGDDLVSREFGVIVRIAGAVRRHAEEGRGGDLLEPLRIVHRGLVVAMGRPGEFVTGELLADELIPRFVLVERSHHVVAIAPGLRTGRVGGGVAVRIRVARHIEPVTRPTFAVGRRGEESIDDPLMGLRRGIREKGIDFRRFRKQSGEIERDPPQPGRAIGLGGEVEPLFGHGGREKGVDRGGGIPDLRHLGTFHRLEGPMRALFLRDERTTAQGLGLGTRRLGPLGDPLLEDGDFRWGHRMALLRHLAALDDGDEFAQLRLARDEEGGPALEGRVHEAAQAEIDARLGLFFLTVAEGAVRLEERSHILLESQEWLFGSRRCNESDEPGEADSFHPVKMPRSQPRATTRSRTSGTCSRGKAEGLPDPTQRGPDDFSTRIDR